MRYTNISQSTINFRDNDVWYTVHPGQTVDIELRFVPNGLSAEIVSDSRQKPVAQAVPVQIDTESLKDMTKDELNDFAAIHNLVNVKSSMTKAQMIKKIKESLK
jgi:hypothetical protein